MVNGSGLMKIDKPKNKRGCSRYILDKEAVGQSSYCVFNHNDSEIDEFIVNHVEKLIRNQNK